MNAATLTAPAPNMLKAALWYAARGWHVLPLHAPIFDDDGACVGCTCEAWKRTQYNKPDYKCPQPGKCPAVKWAEKSTTDSDQLHKWFGHQWKAAHPETGAIIYFTPNLGLDCGKSGLLAFDADGYKENYGGADLLSLADKQTVTSLTGGGGEHLLYDMQGKSYGNATGTLPAGIDIRATGGFIVAPPSLHKSGRRYQFEDGYNPTEIDLLPIPPALAAILEDAQATRRTAQRVTFTAPTTEPPSLLRWRISAPMRALIAAPGTGDRSANDMKVCVSLAYAGATDDDILAVFQHNPIGVAGKFAEAGPAYLARTIGKARTFMEANPRPDVGATISLLRVFITTHDPANYVPKGAGRRCLRKIADAVFDAMHDDQKLTVTIGKKRLGKLAGVDPNTARDALALWAGVLFDVTYTEHGMTVALVDNCRLQQLHPSLQLITVSKGGEVSENDKNLYSPHKADEAFLTGTSRHMKAFIHKKAVELTIWHAGELVQEVTPAQVRTQYTQPGLGEGVLLAVHTAARIGVCTAAVYAQEAGIKLSAARSHLRRAETMGLATAEREGSRGPKVYTFEADFWQRVDELAPTLRTFKLSNQREDKRLESAQQWAQRGEALAATPEEKQTFERRFAKLARQRLPHLARLHPTMSPQERERMAYEVAQRRSPQTAQNIYALRTAQRTDHRETVALVRDLAHEVIKEFVAAGLKRPTQRMVKAQIIKFGVFNEATIRDVLWSPKQMGQGGAGD